MSLPVTHELGPGSVVAVTGAGGFLASNLVQQLLARGVTVHGTLRDPTKPSKRDHLLSLPGSAERLKLFQADLVDASAPAKLAAAFAGVSVVFHTACPFFSLADGKKLGMDFYTKAAIEGTKVVLDACVAAGSAPQRTAMASAIVKPARSW
jgi:nucleoside-diphosphate-sugar epimerase